MAKIFIIIIIIIIIKHLLHGTFEDCLSLCKLLNVFFVAQLSAFLCSDCPKFLDFLNIIMI